MSASTRSATWSSPNAACGRYPATGQIGWVLAAAAALLAIFAPLTGYLYARWA